MIVPALIIIIVMLAIHVPKNNARTILLKETKPLFQRRLEDPLLPPERTYPSNRINIKTQGEDRVGYQQVGFVYNNSNSVRLPLFGKRDFRGSDTWEYYVKDNQDNNNLKIPLDHDKELSTGDIIEISGFNGSYVTEIYELDLPRYLPNVI
jgi:hypothetical protein